MSLIRSLLLVVSLLGAMTSPARAVELVVTCGTIGSPGNFCESSVRRWEQATGHRVRFVPLPQQTTEQLDFLRLSLAQPETLSELDVVLLDAIWINFVQQYLLDLGAFTDGAEQAHFQALIDTARFEGGLKALPLWSDVGLLFYRRDLLEKHGAPVPRTWEELETIAAEVQAAERNGQSDFWGLVFEASAGEGLTCNLVEWMSSLGGGPMVDDDGAVILDTPDLRATLRRVKSWIGTIAPPEVTELNNETARRFFQEGRALFMRNWPYAWSLSQTEDSPLRGKVGVTSVPGGAMGPGRGVHGGWYMGVNAQSRNPEIAADLVLHLTSQAEQLHRALFQSQNPTRPALYVDPDVRAISDFFEIVYDGLQGAISRPNAQLRQSYIHVSTVFADRVNGYLAGTEPDPSVMLGSLDVHLARMRRRGW
jgi:trehalose/maltose transport system substrate-binding protein